MSEKSHPSGQDLSLIFPAPVPLPDLPLPAQFDESCKLCEKKMERMHPCYYGEVRPYATFQCVECKLTLLIFEAPNTPYLIWSDTYHGIIRFGAFIKERIADRERKREARDRHPEHPA